MLSTRSIYEFIKKNYKEAIKWYKLAKSNEDKQAKQSIKRVQYKLNNF